MIKFENYVLWFIILLTITGQGAAQGLYNDYIIKTNDVLDILVWDRPELSAKVIVLPSGKISCPMIGEVQVNGLTIKEVTEKIRRELLQYFKNPLVSVSPSTFKTCTISIHGEVRNPGLFNFMEGKRLTDYVALTGGITDRANSKHCVIIRKNGFKSDVIKVDLKKAIQQGKTECDKVLLPEDSVYIPRRNSYLTSNMGTMRDAFYVLSTGLTIYFLLTRK